MNEKIQLTFSFQMVIRYAKFQRFGISMLVILMLVSCSPKTEQPVISTKALSQAPKQIATVKPEDLPPPIKAKYLDPDSIAPPKIIPLKYQPTVVPAHPNVHPIGKPKVTQIPKDLHTVTLGTDVPMPEIIPAKPTVVPAYQSKPIPALTSRMRDAAIYDLQYLSEDEGLPNVGKSMIEDNKGNIWMSGFGGIVRYDGENFFHFTAKEGFVDADVADVDVLMEDSKGNIWFTAWNGFGYYDGKVVRHFGEQEGLEQNWWTTIFEDSKGQIWLGSDKGVYCYDGQNFTFFKKENGLINGARKAIGEFFDNRINAIFEDSRGHIWWATQGSGVLRYDGQRIIHYTEKEGLISNYIGCILEDSKGQLWFGSGGEGTTNIEAKGISIYNRAATMPQSLGGTFTNYTTKDGLSDNRIEGMVEDDWGKIWLATYNKGLTCYAPPNPDSYQKEGCFIHYTTEEGLSYNSVLSLLKDSKKNIWVGLNNDGEVMRFKPNSFRHFTEEQGLGKNKTTRIIEDGKGNIWLGSEYGGLTKYDGQNFIHYSEKEDLLNDFPIPILGDKQGKVWVSTRDKGVLQFDGKIFKHFGIEQGFIYPMSRNAHQDKQGQIWLNNFLLSKRIMLIRYNPETGQITRFESDEKEGVGSGYIFEDKQQLWFGGMNCIAKHDAINDQVNYVLQFEIENPGWANLLFEDDTDNLWFNNPTHLFKMKKNGDNTTIPSLTRKQVSPDIQVVTLVVDKSKKLWFSTRGDGIGVMPDGTEGLGFTKPSSWILYNKKDGLKSLDYWFEGSFIDSKNRLWASSTNAGVTMLDLNTFELPTEAPKNLSLSHIDIQQRSIDFTRLRDSTYSNTLAFGTALNESFDAVPAFKNYPTNLNLPYDLNHLTFHFAAIDWYAPHDIQYSYKMEGLDKEWSPLSAKAEADYRSIPFGTYTFKVKTIGKAQIWSKPYEYTFTILPPWWHTWWAYGLYAVLAFGVTGWYIQRLRRQINQKQQQLNRELHLNQELAVTNNKLAKINVANSRFVPNDFLQILGKESITDLQLGDQTEATMTILFADIRDYTTLSEKMTPEENFKLINAFLGRMGPIIEANDGFICQYFGDGIMALFKENHDLAINAAVEMQQALNRYNKKRFVRNRQSLRVGIGLNTGQLMLGVIGDKNRYDSSVISDAVNTASRMEGLTKVFGCGVIVSEKTLAEIESVLSDTSKVSDTLEVSPKNVSDTSKVSDTLNYRFLGKVKVKGKNQTLKIYDFFDGDAPDICQLKMATKTNFEKAIHFYFDRKFGKAADLLKIIATKFPEDIATEYYLTKAVKYVIDGVDINWNGVEEMVSK